MKKRLVAVLIAALLFSVPIMNAAAYDLNGSDGEFDNREGIMESLEVMPEISYSETEENTVIDSSDDSYAEISEEIKDEEDIDSSPKISALKSLLGAPLLGAAPRGIPADPEHPTERDPWYPTVSDDDNEWQIVSGEYPGPGKSYVETETQKVYENGNLILSKSVIPTADENVFTIALKIRAKASYADILDATKFRLQNGNSDSSSKVDYFYIKPHSTSDVRVTVRFYNAPNNLGNDANLTGYPLIYTKYYYIAPSISGQMFLYYNNDLIGMGDHGGQKQKVTDISVYNVPVGTEKETYDQLHHALVPYSVTDTMGQGVHYIEGSISNATQVPGVTGYTNASCSNDVLTWNIDGDGTIPVAQDYKLVYDASGPNGQPCFYREYDLTYQVHLDASDSNFVPGQVYPTNDSAELTYGFDPRPEEDLQSQEYWRTDYESQSHTAAFPVPTVKGTLYDLEFTKVDEITGEPLPDAVFALDGDYGVPAKYGATATHAANQTYSLTATSDEDGIVRFENVPWGTYNLSETSAPYGYDITFTGSQHTLCYTTTPDVLTAEDGGKYLYNRALIGNNGIVTNRPWTRITVEKIIDDIDSVPDAYKDTAFPISITNIPSGMTFMDESGNAIASGNLASYLSHSLKNGESFTLYAKMTEDKTVTVSETLGTDSKFDYADIAVETLRGDEATCTKSDNGGAVTISPFSDVKISIHNTYVYKNQLIQKGDATDPDAQLEGAEFDIYTSDVNEAPSGAETRVSGGTTYYKLGSCSTDSYGLATLYELSIRGTPTYLLRETKAPDGYFTEDSDILFQFDPDDGYKVKLLSSDSDVSIITSGSDDVLIIRIEDHPIYALPSSGGHGAFVFTFTGTLILIGAVMIIISMKKDTKKSTCKHY